MIKSIEIKNFRCFKDTKVTNFGLVNLFGGMNNAGKTALLEAIYLTESPNSSSIMFLQRVVRKEEPSFVKEKPKNAWDNLFFQQNKEQEISLTNINTEEKKSTVILCCDEEIEDLINYIDHDSENNDINQIHSALSEKDSIKSALHIKLNRNKEHTSILVASKSGIVGRGSPGLKIDNACFIPASLSLSVSSLAEEYEKARFEDKGDLLLGAFQIIDETIEKIEVFSIGKPLIYLKRKNENKMPIGLFGDAINKIANFILNIINNPNSIILIDEIENGIHHTNQEELWSMIFDLAIKYNVQIFSTTHSYEMLKAFSNIGQKHPGQAAYFEMIRNPKNNLIKGIRHDLNTLPFELDRNISIRGE